MRTIETTAFLDPSAHCKAPSIAKRGLEFGDDDVDFSVDVDGDVGISTHVQPNTYYNLISNSTLISMSRLMLRLMPWKLQTIAPLPISKWMLPTPYGVLGMSEHNLPPHPQETGG